MKLGEVGNLPLYFPSSFKTADQIKFRFTQKYDSLKAFLRDYSGMRNLNKLREVRNE